jgi:hypothetical protein
MTKKPTSKVDTVIALAQRKAGCTTEQIMSKLNVGKVAALSLIGDARRKGVKLKRDDGGRYRAPRR